MTANPIHRVGRMPYANSLVFYSSLPADEVALVTLPPRNMAAAVRRGDLDAGPLPTYEVLRLGSDVVPLDDYGVATDGEARSVLLFSETPAEQLSGRRIAITADTSTSVQLLRILLQSHWRAAEAQLVGPSEACEAMLVIGDAALERRRADTPERRRFGHVYDLAGEWKRLTGLPFVFARWVARRECDVDRLTQLVAASFDHGMARIDEIAADYAVSGYAPRELGDYIRNFVYRLGERELAAVEEFRIRLENLDEWEPDLLPYTADTDHAGQERAG